MGVYPIKVVIMNPSFQTKARYAQYARPNASDKTDLLLVSLPTFAIMPVPPCLDLLSNPTLMCLMHLPTYSIMLSPPVEVILKLSCLYS